MLIRQGPAAPHRKPVGRSIVRKGLLLAVLASALYSVNLLRRHSPVGDDDHSITLRGGRTARGEQQGNGAAQLGRRADMFSSKGRAANENGHADSLAQRDALLAAWPAGKPKLSWAGRSLFGLCAVLPVPSCLVQQSGLALYSTHLCCRPRPHAPAPLPRAKPTHPEWPIILPTLSPGPTQAALVVLARNSDVEGLASSMRQLEQRFNAKAGYPWGECGRVWPLRDARAQPEGNGHDAC